MILIELAAQANGAHRNQQMAGTLIPPAGWAVVPPTLEGRARTLLPFITLTLSDEGEIADITDNAEARAAYVPEAVPPNEMTLLRAQVAALTQSNQMLEDCIVEMATEVYA